METLKLKQPISFGSETISDLSFREATAKDFRDMPVGDIKVGHMMDMAAKLCAQTPSVIDSLCGADLAEVMRIVGESMERGPETGVKS